MDPLAHNETEEERRAAMGALAGAVAKLSALADVVQAPEDVDRTEIWITHLMSWPRRLLGGRVYVTAVSAEQVEILRAARARLAMRALGLPRCRSNGGHLS